MEQKTYTIKLFANDLTVIGAALGELPHKLAQPVIARIQAQINEQEEKAVDEPGRSEQ